MQQETPYFVLFTIADPTICASNKDRFSNKATELACLGIFVKKIDLHCKTDFQCQLLWHVLLRKVRHKCNSIRPQSAHVWQKNKFLAWNDKSHTPMS